MKSSIARLSLAQRELYPLAQGGTAVGTGLNSKPQFAKAFAKRIAAINQNFRSYRAPNKFEHMAGHDAYVFVHGALNAAATALFKIANDIRLLGSGPRSGLGELILPSNELGSSIMPGKTNPTQSEALTMVCAQRVRQPDHHNGRRQPGPFRAQRLQAGAGLLHAAIDPPASPTRRNLSPTIASSASRPTKRASRELMQRSLMLVTALAPKIGYDKAAPGRESGARQRHHAARGSGAARFCQRRRVRPPGAPGKNDPPALSRMPGAECNSGAPPAYRATIVPSARTEVLRDNICREGSLTAVCMKFQSNSFW